jgi:hypothetical protein
VTRLSPDTRAVVAAVDRLTTQVRRLADTRQTPTVDPVDDDGPTTPDDGEATCPTPLTHNWGCGCPTDEAPAAHTQALRWARRESLLVLVTRVQHGRPLTDDEARTLREHVETEMREAETARAVAADRGVENRALREKLERYGQAAKEQRQRAEELEDELRRWHAAVERVHAECAALTAETEHTHYEADTGIREAVRRIRAALDGTEQPTTD